MRAIRTLLVDGNMIFLGAASEFLSGYPRIQLLEWASSGAQALEMIPHLRPDLVLVDSALRDESGFEITRKVKAMEQAPAVILLSLFESKKYRKHAAAFGADGIISKSDFALQLLPLVTTLFHDRMTHTALHRTPATVR